MSTRCNIGIVNPDNSITVIYCHMDGYPAHVGRILHLHYREEEKVRQLIGLGDISAIGPEIGEKIDFMTHPINRRNQCLAYGRDRGEEDTEARELEGLASLMEAPQQYVYLWNDGRWVFCGDDGIFQLLIPALCGIDNSTFEPVKADIELTAEDLEEAGETWKRG
jgi:hypothetical protein